MFPRLTCFEYCNTTVMVTVRWD